MNILASLLQSTLNRLTVLDVLAASGCLLVTYLLPHLSRLELLVQRLCEAAAASDLWSLPVEQENWRDQRCGDARELVACERFQTRSNKLTIVDGYARGYESKWR